MRVVAAVDKFRGTLDADGVAAAIAAACDAKGHDCDRVPLADGGEGLLEAFGGATEWSTVTGPAGEPVRAGWYRSETLTVIEMAQAAGLALAGGADVNRPEAATTAGVGELLLEAVRRGTSRIVVGMGGSATSDGGRGAVDVLESSGEIDALRAVDIVIACDVDTAFVDAGRVFGPQKGADAAAIERITGRLEALADTYRSTYGVDVTTMPGAGAAGGLAGGLAAATGATISSGFELVAGELGLAGLIDTADLVITGEGSLDPTSRNGKVVGGVLSMCTDRSVEVHAIAGIVRDVDWIPYTSLVETFGEHRALTDTQTCVVEATHRLLEARSSAAAPDQS